MIEPIMYSGVGFLFAALIGLVVMPRIHDRAVRLTMRRLEAAIPLSIAEVQADKDLLRAEFALLTRRLEMSVEQLRNKATSQLAELGKKGDAINQLKIERDAQKVEIIAFNSQLELLKQQLTSAGKEVGAEGSSISLVPKGWPTAELVKVPMDSLQSPLNDQLYEDGWLGQELTFLPGRGPWSRRCMYPLAPPISKAISSRATRRRLADEYSAGLLAFSLEL
jgi:F0F1-type ATP synthase membrane subunit b/b'